LETAMTGMEKMLAYREQMLEDRIDRLDAHNRAQDQQAKAETEAQRSEIKEIKSMVWSAVKWLGSATGLVLLSATFKTLGLL
jgi:RPA family protein